MENIFYRIAGSRSYTDLEAFLSLLKGSGINYEAGKWRCPFSVDEKNTNFS